MSEHTLGKSLLQAGTNEHSGPLEGRHLTAQVLDRDRRRIRLLGAAILLLWLLGAGGITFALYKLSVYVPEYMAFQGERVGTRSIGKRQDYQEGSLGGVNIGLVVITSSVALLALAGLGTFLLVLDARRATLRQINASLTLISERLQRLQELRERESAGQPAQRDLHSHLRRET